MVVGGPEKRRLAALAAWLLALPWAAGSCELICEVPPPLTGDAEAVDVPPEADAPADPGEVQDDGFDDGPDGEVPATCGNGSVDDGEECDDANAAEDDGCRSDCRFSCHADRDCEDGDPCTIEACRPGGTGRRCEAGPAGPPPPQPLGPPNGARTGSHLLPPARQSLRPALRWRPPACPGVSYDVQIDDSCPAIGFGDCEFPSPEGSATGLAATSWRPPSDLPVDTTPPAGRRYFWRVRSVLPGVGPGPWSPPRYLDVGRAPGDLDGDGHADLAVGAPGDGSGAGTGRVYIFLGATVPDDTPDVTLDRPAGSRFGEAVAAAGDVNGDGFCDLLVGDPNYSTTGRNHGAAFVYYGGNPLPATPALTLEGGFNGEELGAAVAGAGDVDADGAADWLVGIPSADTGGSDAGRVLLLQGGAAPDVVPDWTRDGAAAGDRFGATLGGAGDIDADGFADFLVGAPGTDGPGGSDAGAAFLVRGGPMAGLVATEDEAWFGEAPAEAFGASLAGIGDLDADGFDDVAVGAPGAADGRGRVALFRGGATFATTPDATFEGAAPGDRFGDALAGAGDVNGDGVPDWLVGAPLADGVAADAGRAYLFAGSWPPAAIPGVTFDAAAAGNRHGAAVAGIGDLDADGFADFAIGAPQFDGARSNSGRVTVGLGSAAPTSTPALAPEGAVMGASLGSAIASTR